MKLSRVLALAALFTLALTPAFAHADLQGDWAKKGEVLKQDGEFFPAGDGRLRALYDRLVEADAMEAKINSLNVTIDTLQSQVKEFRGRAELTTAQQADYEKLRQTYELHLEIYRDAINQYKALLLETRNSAEALLKMVKELSDANAKLHRELFWTRLLGPLYMLVGIAGMALL